MARGTMTKHLLLLIGIALSLGSGNAQDDPESMTGEEKCTALKGQIYNGHCYWMPSWKGGRFKQNKAAGACGLLSSNVVSLDDSSEWEFFSGAAPNIVLAVTGKGKAKVFVTGAGAAAASSMDEYASGSSGNKCLQYNVKSGSFMAKKCKSKFNIFCEADDPTQIELTWSEWINDWTGKKYEKHGDDKEISKKIIAKRRNVCPNPLTIQCRDSVSKASYLDTGDVFKKPKFACTLKHGLECRAKDNQNKAPCKDYEVRFLCPAVEDECTSGKAICGDGANCVDTFEGYYCGCGSGKKKNKGGDCGSYTSCGASGDPHFTSFDGLKFDMQGTCRYITTVPCDIAPADPTYWRVTHDQEHRSGKTKVAFLKAVFVEVYDLKITLEKVMVVLVNNIEVSIPSSPHPDVSIQSDKKGVVVKILSLGVSVLYDGDKKMQVDVGPDFAGRLCGLCGNMDGSTANEFMKRDGSVVEEAQIYDWANDWLAPGLDDPSCVADQPGPITCTEVDKNTYSAIDQCGIITDPEGPFADGIGLVDAQKYFDDCVFDMCAYDGDESILCKGIDAFESAIEESGVYVFIDTWRTDSFCPFECPKNSHYSEVVSPCADNCYVPPGTDTCEGEPYEGCEADEGFVKNGGNGGFVVEEDCGCTDDEGNYHELGARWRSLDCTNDYKCRIDGDIFVTSQHPPCPANSKCASSEPGTTPECLCDDGFTKDGDNNCVADANPPTQEPAVLPDAVLPPDEQPVLPPVTAPDAANPPAPVIPQGLPDSDEPASEYRANWCGGKWYIRQL